MQRTTLGLMPSYKDTRRRVDAGLSASHPMPQTEPLDLGGRVISAKTFTPTF